MNNNGARKAQVTIYVDGVCMGTFNGWRNARAYEAKQVALGRTVTIGGIN